MRVSVTNVDALDYCLSVDMTLDETLRRLRHEALPTEQMLAGRAFHDILEHPPSDELDIVERYGHRFEFAFDGSIRLPTIREVKAEVPVRVSGVDVTLVGRIDCLHGQRIDDHKMTAQFAAERYTNAFQWRAYLWAFNAVRFQYNVFPASQLKDGIWRIRGLETLQFCAYPGLEHDVIRRLSEYVNFCHTYMKEAE